jgi:hypothetical protein
METGRARVKRSSNSFTEVIVKYEASCPNMNHSRSNAPIKFCPSCGKSFGNQAFKKCDNEKHAARRKGGDQFCIDCGLPLKNM